MERLVTASLVTLLVCFLMGTVFVWLMPVDAVQTWALKRSPGDQFARFEALGQAEALWWLARVVLPGLLLLTVGALKRVRAMARLMSLAWQELCGMAGFETRPIRGTVLLLFFLGWAVLAARHAVLAVMQRTRDWPYYRTRGGQEVLPNISFSNRDVIRYLQSATPDDATILVLSDQKLFFLSYYLLPRRLYHPMHPEAEFVIPLANQARQLPAYRLEDLDLNEWRPLQPDYILEYYEGSDYVEADRIAEDKRWLAFWRQRNQTHDLPPFLLVLKPFPSGEEP